MRRELLQPVVVAGFVLVASAVLIAGCAGTRAPTPPLRDGGGIGFPDAPPRWNGDSGPGWLGDGAADGRAVDAGGGGGRKDSGSGGARDSAPRPDRGLCPNGCDDNNPCTVDTCVGPSSCKHTAKSCNDNNACTVDKCVAGRCTHTPKSCDDGNSCTGDSCVNGQCRHDKLGTTIYRFYNSGTGAHAYLPTTTAPSGFTYEGGVFRLMTGSGAGRGRVYQQVRSSNGDHMLSRSSSEGVTCCGYSSSGSIGWGFTSSGNGRIPIYRLYWSSTGLHLSSASSSEGTQIGYKLEGVTFYACPR